MKRIVRLLALALIAGVIGCGGGETGKASGGKGDGKTSSSAWPDEEIKLYGPGTDSGTFDYFTKVICGEEKASRADYTASEDDNVLVTGVQGDKYALAYFGYAYYEENKSSLKLLAVDDGTGCVAPSPASVRDGSYKPLSRPLYIYVSKKSLARPEVAALVGFYLKNAGALASDVGYVPVSDEVAAANNKALQEALAAAGPAPATDGEPSVKIDGSSTVFPISEAVAEEFRNEDSKVRVTVGYWVLGAGMQKMAAGELDIADASRGIKDSEIQACADAGIELIELSVAFDGLAVVTNPANEWCDCLTVEQLKKLWSPDSKVTKWSELKP